MVHLAQGVIRVSWPAMRSRLPTSCMSKIPIVIVVPGANQYLLSAATRIAHNLFSYLRADIQIYYDYEAINLLGNSGSDCSNLVILGGSANTFGQLIMSGHPGGVLFTEKGWKVQGNIFESSGLGS